MTDSHDISTSALLERAFPGRRASLKRAILEAALGCFNQHGIEATTIDMVRTAADTSVGAIYHHFGNKEGLVSALFFTALDDQAALREQYLAHAQETRDGVHALVHSYLDWVVANADWARFMFQSRNAMSQTPQSDALMARNRQRTATLLAWLADPARQGSLRRLPPELVPALIIGPCESYCRAWLSGRTQAGPETYRDLLAEAAWRAVGA